MDFFEYTEMLLALGSYLACGGLRWTQKLPEQAATVSLVVFLFARVKRLQLRTPFLLLHFNSFTHKGHTNGLLCIM